MVRAAKKVWSDWESICMGVRSECRAEQGNESIMTMKEVRRAKTASRLRA